MWNECKALQNEIVSMRRELHRIPELGLNLPKTADYVAATLDKLDIPYVRSERDSSIIAELKGGKPGKTVALRADMDALPITEETGLPFASEHPGCMHACGHDTHMAMLLGAAKVLKAHENEICGNVRFLFQTAEEISKGAQVVVANGGVDGVDAVFGTHIGTVLSKDIPAGTFVVPGGTCMASFDRFVVTVKGAGCHGSAPEKGIDPINIAAHIILALQTITVRELSAVKPLVLTIGKICGGAQYNIIPSEVVIEGTIRAIEENVRQFAARRIEEISAATAQVFGGEAETFMDWGAPPVTNDAAMAALAAKAAKKVAGDDMVITELEAPNMGGEDFAYYLEKVPGAFMFLSSANREKGTDVSHHNSHFDVDEDVLWEGAALFVAIVEEFLNGAEVD